jgi:hypothetical protein
MRWLRLGDTDLAPDRTMIPLDASTMTLNAAKEIAARAGLVGERVRPAPVSARTAGARAEHTQRGQDQAQLEQRATGMCTGQQVWMIRSTPAIPVGDADDDEDAPAGSP